MNLAVCAALPKVPENGTWFRAVFPHYGITALSSSHTTTAASRFNGGSKLNSFDQFEALYFASNPLVAQFEFGAMLGDVAPGRHVANPRGGHIMMSAQIILREVVDLTDVAGTQTPLETNAQELTGDWKGYDTRNHMTQVSGPTGIAPTQELGRALYMTGIEAFQSISARVPYERTLTIFPKNMRRGSSVVVSDYSGRVIHQIRP